MERERFWCAHLLCSPMSHCSYAGQNPPMLFLCKFVTKIQIYLWGCFRRNTYTGRIIRAIMSVNSAQPLGRKYVNVSEVTRTVAGRYINCLSPWSLLSPPFPTSLSFPDPASPSSLLFLGAPISCTPFSLGSSQLHRGESGKVVQDRNRRLSDMSGDIIAQHF